METYSFNLHRHNYAIWTAARAVQRNFTKTINIKYAIEQTGLREFVESTNESTRDEFNDFHKFWAYQIDNALKSKNIETCSYGRAAKIISIYLKTAIILCNQGSCQRCNYIHPPIDGILLKNISKFPELSDLKSVRWTHLCEEKYWELVDRLTNHFKMFDWRLECYWSPERD